MAWKNLNLYRRFTLYGINAYRFSILNKYNAKLRNLKMPLTKYDFSPHKQPAQFA